MISGWHHWLTHARLNFATSVLFGMHSLFAIAVFLSRIYYLRRHGKAHHLKRTTWIYWPTQICMMAAAGIAWMLSLHAYLSPNGPVIVAWGCLSLGIAWVRRNTLEILDTMASQGGTHTNNSGS